MIHFQLFLVNLFSRIILSFELEPFLMGFEMDLNPFHALDRIPEFGLLILSELGEVQFVVFPVGLHSLSDELFGSFDRAMDAVGSFPAA